MRDGIVLAIIGRPNAGKSSLLNALSGQESAIVTAIPGTTRDVLREQIDLEGIPVHVADTAGIRETSDLIEAEGVRRARQALESADIVLLVMDVSNDADSEQDLRKELPAGVTRSSWATRLICCRKESRMIQESRRRRRSGFQQKQGRGWMASKQDSGAVGATDQVEGSFSARQRHIDALKRAAGHLTAGGLAMETSQAGELLAEELRLAQQALGEITGEMLPDDLLGEIFSSFCIGK